MVIQCSSCDTRFKIADDKVKAGGVKVRCSKCKEVFTVLPPDEKQSAAEAPSGGLGAMNASFSGDSAQTSSGEKASSLDDVDWSSLNSDETESSADESDETEEDDSTTEFSFGDDEEETSVSEETFSIGDSDTGEAATDAFSFNDDESGPESSDVEDSFAFGSTDSDDSIGVDEPVGEGAQDEFSFDDSPAVPGGADDFDWDGSSSTESSPDDDSFGFGESGSDADNLDFSSLEMAEDETTAPLEVQSPRTVAAPDQKLSLNRGESRPMPVKGPQKGGVKGRGGKRGVKAKKKSGPLRGLMTLLLLLSLVVGGSLYGLMQMGFWSGNFEELQEVDYMTAGQTAWEKVMVEINKLTGNDVAMKPVGSINVSDISGRYLENDQAGTLFVIEGKARNGYATSRSAIAVRGILYDTTGALVNQQKVYCGNSIDDKTLKTEKLDALLARGTNEFGDSLSNLDVAPGATLPFTIVFNNLPKNLSEYNVEAADSAAGTKQ